MGIDFTLPPEVEDVRLRVRKFMEAEVRPVADGLLREGADRRRYVEEIVRLRQRAKDDEIHEAERVAERREGQRYAGQRQRHRIAGHQRGDDRHHHKHGEEFGERHQRTFASAFSARIACATPCSAISAANSGISVLSTNTSGRPLDSCERSRIAQERAA